MDENTIQYSGLKKYFDLALGNKKVVIVLLILGYVYPIGCYFMWKGEHFSKTTRWVVTAVMVFRFVLVNIMFAGVQTSNTDSMYEEGSSCSSVYQEGGCTYYRDSNCAVIGRDCDW